MKLKDKSCGVGGRIRCGGASSSIYFGEAQPFARFHIVQESRTTDARDAEAYRADIALAGDGACWRLVIRDDVRGFDAENPRPRPFGLAGIGERAPKRGAAARIGSPPGAGTTSDKSIPTILSIERSPP